MSWIDLKLKQPTEDDGRVLWRLSSGIVLTGSWDYQNVNRVAWMPIPEFVPIPDPPDGYELLTDYAAKPDPDALFLDIGANRWIIRQHTENSYVFGTRYVVPVKPPVPPQPQYRPFKDAEEFKPFRDRWFVYKNDPAQEDRHRPPMSYTPETYGYYTWADAFERIEFDDGTPFGMLIEPAESDQ